MDQTNAYRGNDLLKAQAHVYNLILNYINSMSLKCAIQLGIPDAVHAHGIPITVPELIKSLPGIHPSKSDNLRRLMRILTHTHIFSSKTTLLEHDREEEVEEEEEAYSLAPDSQILLRDSPVSVVPFVMGMLDPVLLEPWNLLSEWFGRGDAKEAFAMFHGSSLWDLAKSNPRVNNFFNEAMVSDTRLVNEVLVKECRWAFEGLRSVVDVGGGTGEIGEAVSASFDGLEFTVFDLPHVVNGLKGRCDKLKFVGGDMFVSIPKADAALLKWILHDWSDEECIKILKVCKDGIPCREEGGKVIIIDIVMDVHQKAEDDEHPHAHTETKIQFDMLLMVTVNGKERSEKEWANLFSHAGFTHYNITPILGLKALIQMCFDAKE